MSEQLELERRVADWLRAGAPPRAPGRVLTTALDRVSAMDQEQSLGGRRINDWIGRSPRLHWAIVGAILAAALLGAIAGAGALLDHRETLPTLDLTPPSDLQAFVLSSYDRMPEMPPVAITTLDGSAVGRIYVDRSGAVRFEQWNGSAGRGPTTYKILNGTRMGQLAFGIGSDKVWVEQDGAISEDPRVFLLAEMLGGAANSQPGCEVTRTDGEVGNGSAASGWRYVGVEYVAGRPAHHVTCGSGSLWIDIETRLILRSWGPARDKAFQPIPGLFRTIEVTGLAFGEQPADLFRIVQPAGVASMSSEAYQCQLAPTACATPAPTQPAYTPPPAAIQGPLPPLPPSPVKNGLIAYSTDGQDPGSTDVTAGSDIYLIREGGGPRLIAGRDGGATRNVCPAFSPDGTRLAFGVASNPGRAIVVIGLDANGVITDTVRITVPGSGAAACVRWSSDGKRVGYLDGGVVVVRGLDGSTPAIVAGDPGVKDLERVGDPSAPLFSPSGDRVARLSFTGNDCQLVVAGRDGTAAHVIQPSTCGYAVLAAWSPDGRQVLLLREMDGTFGLRAIGVDSPLDLTVVATVSTDGSRSSPGRGDVSWQPILP
jgi:hypothetical protein